MQININFETVKKLATYALVVTNLLGFAGAIHYYQFRKTANPVFQVMEFDLNSRKDAIQAAYAAALAKAQADAAKAQQQLGDAAGRALNIPAPTPAPAPAKK